MTDQTWDALRSRYPWPETLPDVPPDPQGFFDLENEQSLRPAFVQAASTRPLVLELGTWKGSSAKWMLETYREARVICVDLWAPEETYATHGKWGWLAREPHVFETCQRNLWEYRDRCLLIRAKTVDGLALVYDSGLRPDVVYVDAGHEYDDVSADVRGVLARFDSAIVLGDDYNFPPVRQAVHDVAAATDRVVIDERSVWRLALTKTKWGDYEREYGLLNVAGQKVLDLGAEYGSTAQYFLGRGAARIYVSELEPKLRQRLQALADVDPRMRLLPALDGPRTYEVWMRELAPQCVKVDIEGGELHLLACSEAAFRAPLEYAMETHSHELHEALVERLVAYGYRVTVTRRFASNPTTKVLHATRRPA